jgi:hypothetical protein
MVGSDTQTVDGCTLMSVGGTLTIGDDTWMVNGNTLMVGSGTLTGHDQHRLGITIASRTRQHRHQHDLVATSCHDLHRLGSAITSTIDRVEDLILHPARGRVGFNKDHRLSCVDQGRKSLPSSYFIILPIFTWRSDQMSR